MKNHFLLFLFFSLLFFNCKEEDETVPKSTVEGKIQDEFGNVLSDVKVVLMTGSAVKEEITTSNDGQFKFFYVPVGRYTLQYSKENYVTGRQEIEVQETPFILDLILTSGASFMKVSAALFEPSFHRGGSEVRIESNTNWVITSDAPWVKTAVTAGAGNKNLFLQWEESTEDVSRKGVVSIKAGSIEHKILIQQGAPLKLLSVKAEPGNLETDVNDSVVLFFNAPVTVSSLTSSYQYCLSALNYKVKGQRVSFSYACGSLGGEFPFLISVKDQKNLPFQFQFNAQFFSARLKTQGYIRDYFITEDNKALWAITYFPNKLIKVALPSLTVQKEVSLDFEPTSISWNEFKNTINIFNNSQTCDYFEIRDGECSTNNLMQIDPNSLTITATKIDPISQYETYVFPRSLSTFNDGKGVVILNNENYNYYNWRLIDQTKKDSTYFHGRRGTEYQSSHESFDGSSIYLTHSYGGTGIDILEKGSLAMITYKSPLSGRSNVFLANKKTNRFYHGQLYEQFISDLNGYVSYVSYLDTRWFYGGVDFSYRPNEEETMFFLSDGTLSILDYKKRFTYLSTSTMETLSAIQTTTDGKYLLGYRRLGTGGTELYIFDIDNITINQIPRGANQRTVSMRSSSGTKPKSAWQK